MREGGITELKGLGCVLGGLLVLSVSSTAVASVTVTFQDGVSPTSAYAGTRDVQTAGNRDFGGTGGSGGRDFGGSGAGQRPSGGTMDSRGGFDGGGRGGSSSAFGGSSGASTRAASSRGASSMSASRGGGGARGGGGGGRGGGRR